MKGLHVIGEVKNRPERIISLASSLTETLLFLGLERKVVGVTENCTCLDTTKKNKVGTFAHPEFEAILRLKPDLVLTKSRTDEHFLQMCQETAIPVMIMNPANVAEIFEGMEEIARITGVENGKNLVDSLRNRVGKAAPISGLRRPRVFRLMTIRPCMTPTASSYQFDAIRLAGGEPFQFKSTDAYVQANPADIIAFDPEIIISCGKNSDNKGARRCPGCKRPYPPCARVISETSELAELQQTSAVKNHRIFAVPCEFLCHPGPKLVEGIEWMAPLFQEKNGEL